MQARWRLPPLTEPTATPLALTELASPSVSPAGSGNCETTPLCHCTGSRLEPKRVVAPVPTTSPLSFALLETQKLRPARFGRPTIPPALVQLKACAAPVRTERPTATPPGDTLKPWEVVSPTCVT